jgi:hypothetical protein
MVLEPDFRPLNQFIHLGISQREQSAEKQKVEKQRAEGGETGSSEQRADAEDGKDKSQTLMSGFVCTVTSKLSRPLLAFCPPLSATCFLPSATCLPENNRHKKGRIV